MSQVILTIGIPASGKSTWAKAWVEEDPDRRVRVNRDDIRMMMFGRPHGVDERLVTNVQNAAIRAAVRAGLDVVVDNTNLNAAHRHRLEAQVAAWGASITHRRFVIDVEAAIRRDAERDNPVGANVIRNFARMVP